MITIIEHKQRAYEVRYSRDFLLEEKVWYVDDLQAWVDTPRGNVEVKSARILNALHEKLEDHLRSEPVGWWI